MVELELKQREERRLEEAGSRWAALVNLPGDLKSLSVLPTPLDCW